MFEKTPAFLVDRLKEPALGLARGAACLGLVGVILAIDLAAALAGAVGLAPRRAAPSNDALPATGGAG